MPRNRNLSYRRIFAIAAPIILQNSISSCASLVDNLMVGSLGSEVIGGISIAGQILNVYTFLILGLAAGAGVFGAQFHGANDTAGVQHCFRLRLLLTEGITLLAIPLLWFGAPLLIRPFLTAQSDPVVWEQTMTHAREYLLLMLAGLPFFALTQCYAATLREGGDVRLPMIASIAGVAVNVLFNYLLIYGIGPFPALGVRGAALATALSRLVEIGILIYGTHRRRAYYAFAKHLYRFTPTPAALVKNILIKSAPLALNQLMFSLGETLLNRYYSTTSEDAMVAMNVACTYWNFFATVFISFGSVIGILVGHELGCRAFDKATQSFYTLRRLTLLVAAATALLYAAAALPLPDWYAITPLQQQSVRILMWIQAICMPLVGYAQAAFSALRAGGMTGTTMMIDVGAIWLVKLPIAIVLSSMGLPLITVYAGVQITELVKVLFGGITIRSGRWLHCVIADKEQNTTADVS